MQAPIIKFNTKDKPEFFRELTKKVNRHFKDNQISKFGNWEMKFKTIFMVALYLVPFTLLTTGVITSAPLNYFIWFVMAFGMSGIGLSVMHDANHGSYSKNKKVNQWVGRILYLIGGYYPNWVIQHNVLHHSFTNIHGYDEDIKKSIIRLSPDQPHKPMHRFQIVYGPLLYGLMTIYWCLSKDFEQLVRYEKQGLLEKQGLTYRSALTKVILSKIGYLGFTLALPMIFAAMPWYHVLLGFLFMHFITGQILAFIFQPAHVHANSDFYKPDELSSVENSWAVLQMKTTANFANKSRLFSWYVGGLNYQIEHHLFPNICHVHYRAISKIVKQTAKEHDVPYYEYKTFTSAVMSHLKLLWQLGADTHVKKNVAFQNMAKAA